MNEEPLKPDGSPNYIDLLLKVLKYSFGLMDRTQREAFKSTVPHAGVLQVCLLLAIVALVLLVIAAIALMKGVLGVAYACLVIVALMVIALTIGMILVAPGRNSSQSITRRARAFEGELKWERVILDLPAVIHQSPTLGDALRNIRHQAQLEYKRLLEARRDESSDINTDCVRINVFLPDVEAGGRNAQVFELFIPKHLSHGMRDRGEKEIRFMPGQGLTGQVFASGHASGAVFESIGASNRREWNQVHVTGEPSKGEPVFELTDDQNRMIHRDLRWIVSFDLPVTVETSQHTLGVLNIDGLETPLKPDEMGAMYRALKPSIDGFARTLANLPMCTVEVSLHRLEGSV